MAYRNHLDKCKITGEVIDVYEIEVNMRGVRQKTKVAKIRCIDNGEVYQVFLTSAILSRLWKEKGVEKHREVPMKGLKVQSI